MNRAVIRLIWFLLSVLIVLAFWASAAPAESLHPDDRSLAWFRTLPRGAQTALVAGAMAAVGHVGVRCPEPMTVGEQVARLQWRVNIDVNTPWIDVYFEDITTRGCQVEQHIDPNEDKEDTNVRS